METCRETGHWYIHYTGHQLSQHAIRQLPSHTDTMSNTITSAKLPNRPPVPVCGCLINSVTLTLLQVKCFCWTAFLTEHFSHLGSRSFLLLTGTRRTGSTPWSTFFQGESFLTPHNVNKEIINLKFLSQKSDIIEGIFVLTTSQVAWVELVQ